MMTPVRPILPTAWTYDASPDEIESHAELDHALVNGGLATKTIRGLDLTRPPVSLTSVDVRGALFVGCRFADAGTAADIVARGGSVVPIFVETPYVSAPSHLYTPEDLSAGFAAGGFEAMYDTAVYRHFLCHGGAMPDVREGLAQRIHDTGIDRALVAALAQWRTEHGETSVVGVMGGHAEPRGSAAYRLAVDLGYQLSRCGRLVLTGGGPGVMEAANLGAYLGRRDHTDLVRAVELLAASPDFRAHEPYTAAAIAVRQEFPESSPASPAAPVDLLRGGLAIPTWLYGHEPANLFGGGIAKYFSNAIREDTILRAARGGVVFAPGRAGTVQEVFEAATKAFYRSDGPSGPLIFLDATFWTEQVPVTALLAPLLAGSPHGDLSSLVHLTDDVSEAVALLTGG
jgi:predicted Rossmann-fold nucleotide-binding protein